MPKFVCLILLFLIAFTLSNPCPIFAQENGLDVVFSLDVADADAEEGDILISTDEGLKRATEAFDKNLFGVVQNQAVVIYKGEDEAKKGVARTGVVLVNVTNINGEIKVGDYITSSPNPGKGQKASVSGYVIGVALEPLEGNEGKVPVALRIEYAEISSPRTIGRLFGLLGAGLFGQLQTPDKLEQIARYIVAALIAILGFGIGFITLMRSIPKSIEAIGRNPLAKSAIQLSLAVNIALAVLITVAGLLAALVIIKI